MYNTTDEHQCSVMGIHPVPSTFIKQFITKFNFKFHSMQARNAQNIVDIHTRREAIMCELNEEFPLYRLHYNGADILCRLVVTVVREIVNSRVIKLV